MDLPKRKPNRLSYYDYSSMGSYFLTLCAVDKRCLFSRIQSQSPTEMPVVQLSNYGMLLEQQIRSMQQIYTDIHIDHYVIMPNHIHFLISITAPSPGTETPANQRIPAFVSAFKRMTNKTAGYNLWHRAYHDHVIRNEEDYLLRWQYIENNPMKWTLDRFYISEM